MKWKIPLFKTYSDKEDIEAVSQIIKRGTYWAVGSEIESFEKNIADYVKRKYALVFNSGTSALHALLLAHNIKDKEVIVPSFTFIATANTVILAGGKPVFAESEEDTLGLDAEDIEKRINKKTGAILALHYGGFPSRDIEKLRHIAKDNNILLIEDAAEAMGAKIGDKYVGCFGDSAIFSFCQNKIISTGEGGVIVTDDKDIYEKSKLIRSHGRVETSEDYFSSTEDNDYIDIGYNLRMSTISASLGISQLKKIKKVIGLRRKNAEYLNKNLSKIKEIELLKEINNHFQVYQMYTIKLTDEKTRDELQSFLAKKRIMTKVYFNPVHLKSAYSQRYNSKKENLSKTEEFSKRVLTLPMYPDLEKKELDLMISKINEFFEKK